MEVSQVWRSGLNARPGRSGPPTLAARPHWRSGRSGGALPSWGWCAATRPARAAKRRAGPAGGSPGGIRLCLSLRGFKRRFSHGRCTFHARRVCPAIQRGRHKLKTDRRWARNRARRWVLAVREPNIRCPGNRRSSTRSYAARACLCSLPSASATCPMRSPR